MQRNIPRSYPLISRLNNLDYWSWCRSFIDVHTECPFGCMYCNTQRRSDFQGLSFTQRLPEGRETIGIGLISDAYTGDDRQNTMVSEILDFLFREGYSVQIMTKSTAIVKDLDLLKNLAQRDRVRVTFTLLTLNESLSHQLEGSSPGAYERLEALETLRNAQIPSGVTLSPIIPGINDEKASLCSLIRECKKRNACWVLFSGFHMIPSFVKSPLWQKTEEIHNDPERLEKRYRRLRKFLVRLLLRENLPIRIPRVHLDIYRRRYHTQIVSEHLFNLSYLFELKENAIRMLRYRRAAYEIENLNISLKSIASSKKLGYIKGVNPEIEKVIEEVLYTGGSTLHTKLYDSLIKECN